MIRTQKRWCDPRPSLPVCLLLEMGPGRPGRTSGETSGIVMVRTVPPKVNRLEEGPRVDMDTEPKRVDLLPEVGERQGRQGVS